MVMFSKTVTETITIENIIYGVVNEKLFNSYDILYSVENNLNSAIK